jgi:curved DNA-binding protein CbpA
MQYKTAPDECQRLASFLTKSCVIMLLTDALADGAGKFLKTSERWKRMKGTLNDQPLAELIREISSKKLSGSLRLEHERVRAAVYFESGRVIFAAANIRSLRLQEYLHKRALVSEKELARLGKDLSDLDLAAALCTGGLAERNQIDQLLAMMVADVLRVALLWTTGNWDFDERSRLGNPIEIEVDVNNLLREAGQRLPLKFVSGRFRNPNETITRASDISYSGNNLLPSESFLLSRLDAPTRLQDLIALSGLRELDAHRIIYGLALSGVVQREYWHLAFRAAPGRSGKETADVAPPSIKTREADAAAEAAKEIADLETFLERLSEANNYYEIIDLPPEADANEIKLAYYALARRYHPDRFHIQSGTPQHARISSAFAQVTQAYETLTDPNTRSAYDAALERSRRFSGAARRKASGVSGSTDGFEFAGASDVEFEEAGQCFREGFQALQTGQLQVALAQLATAARLAPRDARYRAHYGRALAAGEQTRRLAESELQAAVKLEPSNPKYRTMLAEYYFDLNFHRRAQTELQRALALDPNNGKGRALLRKIEAARRKN